MQFKEICEATLKVFFLHIALTYLPSSLHSLLLILRMFNMHPFCHMAHVIPVVQFVPNLLYHVSVNGGHGSHNGLLQFLKVSWKRWYKHVVLDVSPQETITWCDVWGSGWPLFMRQVKVWDRTSNPALWQMLTEESSDLMVEVM